jgi:hypothetical protein
MNSDRESLAVLAHVVVGARWMDALVASTDDLLAAGITSSVVHDATGEVALLKHQVLRIVHLHESMLGMLLLRDVDTVRAQIIIRATQALKPHGQTPVIAHITGGIVYDRRRYDLLEARTEKLAVCANTPSGCLFSTSNGWREWTTRLRRVYNERSNLSRLGTRCHSSAGTSVDFHRSHWRKH